MADEPRRMLAPWTAEEGESSYVVRTANGFVVSITYFDDEPMRDFNLSKEEARSIALAIARLPELPEKNRAPTENIIEPGPSPHRPSSWWNVQEGDCRHG